jgi:hypothetical protein
MRAKWYVLVETQLNNSYLSFYARKLMYEHSNKFGNGFLRNPCRRKCDGQVNDLE